MAIQIQGFTGGVIADVDGTTFRALRVTNRPLEYGALGHYRLSTGVILVATQAANGTLFSFRWGNASNFCIPLFIRLEHLQSAAATATIADSFQIFIARSFTASDSAGTAITLTGNNMKKRTNMGTTLVTDIRRSAVAAGLTVGTRTLDADPILDMAVVQTITTINPTTYRKEVDFTNSGDMPLVFAQNEGFIVRGPTVVYGAAGASTLFVDMAWAEVASY